MKILDWFLQICAANDGTFLLGQVALPLVFHYNRGSLLVPEESDTGSGMN